MDVLVHILWRSIDERTDTGRTDDTERLQLAEMFGIRIPHFIVIDHDHDDAYTVASSRRSTYFAPQFASVLTEYESFADREDRRPIYTADRLAIVTKLEDVRTPDVPTDPV